MKLFDVNATIGPLPDEPAGADAAGLLAELTPLGIAEAVVSHSRAWLHDPVAGNAMLLEEIAPYDELHPCWVVVPDTCEELGGAERYVAQAVGSGVLAIRALPALHGFSLNGADFNPVLSAAAEARLPLLVDAGEATWPAIEATAAAHPSLPIVVGTVGYRTMRQIAGVLARTENVYVDLSYLGAHLAVEWIVERFGAHRLLFGTGFPHRDPADATTRLLWSELDDETCAAIGAGNLRALVGGSR